MLDILTEFAYFCNKRGFQVGPMNIMQASRFLVDETINFGSEEDMIDVFQICYARNKDEEAIVPEYLKLFCRDRYLRDTRNNLETERHKAETEHKRRVKDLRSSLKKRDGSDEPDFLKKWGEDILKSSQYENLSENIKKPQSVSDLREALNKQLEDALWDNDLSLAEELDRLHKLCEMYTDRKRAYAAGKKQLQDTYKMELENLDTIQKQIDSVLDNGLNDENSEAKILKTKSLRNRKEFLGGSRAVVSLGEGDQLFRDSINGLSAENRARVYYYIRANARKWKLQRMRRVLTEQKKELDMRVTVQDACKMGGIPMKLSYRRRTPSKARVVLVLDISGSCINASGVMLGLMHCLQDVFGGGCHAFAFVNKLYNISGIMNSNDAECASKEVFRTIPTRGVYSDYYRPLRSLWEDYNKVLTRDTIAVFIGDARNNRGDTGAIYLKNIEQRVSRVYWLNTESEEQWDTGDSIAGIYGQYSQMIPVRSVSDLVSFVVNM